VGETKIAKISSHCPRRHARAKLRTETKCDRAICQAMYMRT
jgi:hypothetical protein